MPIHLTKGLGEFLKSQGAIALATNGSALAVPPSKAPNDPKQQITRCYRYALRSSNRSAQTGITRLHRGAERRQHRPGEQPMRIIG